MNRKVKQLVTIQFVLFTLLGLSILIFRGRARGPLRPLGVAMSTAGSLFALYAIYSHRRYNRIMPNISPEPKQQAPLIRRGVYARIRHPIYTGVLLTVSGLGLAHGHVISLLLALILIGFFAAGQCELPCSVSIC